MMCYEKPRVNNWNFDVMPKVSMWGQPPPAVQSGRF